MTATPFEKIGLKIFAREGSDVRPEEFLGIFQRWIQDEKLSGILIDVADYSHVRNGPGILLVSFDEHFSMDGFGGRLGLSYHRKSPMEGSSADRLRRALKSLMRAARTLEEEPALEARLKFRTDEIEFFLEDRLKFPNATETFEAVRGDLESGFAGLFRRNVSIERASEDARELFGVRARSFEEIALSEMAKNF